MEKKALGKGLKALLPEKKAVNWSVGEEVKYLSVDQIIPNRYQPRHIFDESELHDLSQSIKEHGVLQPIIVRRTGDGAYELIAGERRLRAAKIAGLAAIPALVRLSNDEKSLAIALVENVQRQNLNPMEEARAYSQLTGEFGLKQDELASAMGKNRSTIANFLRLISLPSEVQGFVEQEQISLGHAKVILGIKESDDQISMARRIVDGKLSVREAEAIISKSKSTTVSHKVTQKSDEFAHVSQQLRRCLGSKVNIVKSKKGGKLVIHYFSGEDLERIVGVILE